MKSIGIYYKLKDDEKSCYISDLLNKFKKRAENLSDKEERELELHVNLWKVAKHHKKYEYLLDFGLKMDININDVCLYLPFHVDKEQIEDLGAAMMTDRDLLCLLFNANMKITSAKNDCYSTIKNQDSSEVFELYQLGEQNFTLEYQRADENSKENVTLLYIKRKPKVLVGNGNDANASKKIYVRFRIKASNIDAFRISESLQNDMLQNAFSRIEMYDIRVNDQREINKKVMEHVRSKCYKPFFFNKVHLFYMVGTKETLRDVSSMKRDSRLLELKKWRNYLSGYDLTHPYISYHWKSTSKDETPLTDFCILITSVYPKRNFWLLAAYAFAVIILSWLGSMLCLTMPIGCLDHIKIVVVTVLSIYVAILWWCNRK